MRFNLDIVYAHFDQTHVLIGSIITVVPGNRYYLQTLTPDGFV
jgi:hypothetical protein